MSKKQLITPSRLERFKLSFEYDKTLREVKQDVAVRTILPAKR